MILNEPTLVLNRNWTAVRVATVRDALVLAYKGSARIVEPRTYATFDFAGWAERGGAVALTPRLSIETPEVIVLAIYAGTPAEKVVFSRRNLFKRDRFTCQYCGVRPGTAELTIDHVVPRSRGGVSSWENCVLACVACNVRKAHRTPAEAGLTLRTKPRKPAWTPAMAVAAPNRRESWDQFISRAYWNVPLEP